jgi:hypothetical protein
MGGSIKLTSILLGTFHCSIHQFLCDKTKAPAPGQVQVGRTQIDTLYTSCTVSGVLKLTCGVYPSLVSQIFCTHRAGAPHNSQRTHTHQHHSMRRASAAAGGWSFSGAESTDVA